jgi:nucleotide-binding universal stress UspA family protein
MPSTLLDNAPTTGDLRDSGRTHERPTPHPRRHPPRPVVVAVDDSPGAIHAAEAGARLGRDLGAPVVLVYVREGPPSWMGEPYYQRRLDAETAAGSAVLERAREVARRESSEISTEILEGSPARRIPEFAAARNARAVVVGTRRRRWKRSVSQEVIRGAGRPVVVAPE